ncbi:MAG: hypothetical protein DWQ37_08260 [Planctomycetota bacterium]|nr:MAG: hypothetical protein DWQ37_08260 [Planctomycetota bacterium]
MPSASPSDTPEQRFASPGRLRASRMWRHGWLLGVSLAWVLASGASCPHIVQQYTQPIPRALPPAASLTQIVDVVNDNSARVQSLSATRATITTPGFPSLNANIAIQRPRSLRIMGDKFGPQLDVGSNDEMLWLWLAQSQPPALFYCRHDQYETSAARQIMPVEPQWIVEAFGLVTFDGTTQIEGPTPVGGGRVELRTRSGQPGQETSRVTVVDASTGLVLEQHVYDARGTRLASATLSKHALDPASGAKLPRHIDIQWPPAAMEFAIEMADVQVNQLPGDPQQLFTKPVYPGYSEIDLAQPGLQLTPAPSGQYQAAPETRY